MSDRAARTTPRPAANRSPRRRWRWLGGGTLSFAAVGLAAWVVYGGGAHEGPGTVTDARLPEEAVEARAERQLVTTAAFPEDERPERQILFGDLHVHTTFSADAFLMSLPLLGGEGAHPPADACDFARFCSGLDFFALTDHAESLTPRHWRESVDTIQRCNEVAGEPSDPDLVAFMGFEWSQVGLTPETHYGHRNVIFRDVDDAHLPTRPIAASGASANLLGDTQARALLIPIQDFSRRQRYLDLAAFARENASVDACPSGVDVRALPDDCHESAATPRELFDKLDQWGFDSLVIPHGTSWGFYTPAGYTWDKGIAASQDDPERQRLIEVFSGHGSSEEYRPWRAVELDGDGAMRCPEPTEGYEPCCWRAGEIIRARCDDAESDECERRVEEARARYLSLGVAGHHSIEGATVEDWGECGQCTDCFQPAFNLRPGGSAQYVLARGNFDDPNAPRHMRLGMIASSDNHSARPGTGYAERHRLRMTEAQGPRSEVWRDRVLGEPLPPSPEPSSVTPEDLLDRPPFTVVHVERQASFFLTGGLVAVHSRDRTRGAIFEALRERHVYGTSGPRILLWFDLVNAPGGAPAPMGSDVQLSEAPRFVVRAVGAYRQQPGCPAWSADRLGPARLEALCAGECYHPGDERLAIRRIEVVRIRPQIRDDEPLEPLIEDVWRSYECPPGRDSCRVEIEDPDFVEGGRDALYYVRAIQEPTDAVNASNLRCEGGECDPCYGDYRTPADDDCLAETEERAWSSPIWVRHGLPGGVR